MYKKIIPQNTWTLRYIFNVARNNILSNTWGMHKCVCACAWRTNKKKSPSTENSSSVWSPTVIWQTQPPFACPSAHPSGPGITLSSLQSAVSSLSTQTASQPGLSRHSFSHVAGMGSLTHLYLVFLPAHFQKPLELCHNPFSLHPSVSYVLLRYYSMLSNGRVNICN